VSKNELADYVSASFFIKYIPIVFINKVRREE